MILEYQHILQLAITLEIYVSFPPGVDDAGDLVQRLVLEVGIVVGRFDCDLVGAVAGGHLEHSNAPQIDLGKNSESGKLIGHHPGEPAWTIWKLPVVANGEYLGRSLVLSPGAKRTTRSRLRRLDLAPWIGCFGPLGPR